MSSFKQNIYPIRSTNYTEGCGFVIGKFFITAGHVIELAENPTFIDNGKTYHLRNPYFYRNDETFDTEGYDIAIFKIDELHSPLTLDHNLPQPCSEVLFSGFQDTILKGYNNILESSANVLPFGFIGNYMAIETVLQLKSGCSGSPIFQGHKIVGMIVAGNRDDSGLPRNPKLPLNFCQVLTSKSILPLL